MKKNWKVIKIIDDYKIVINGGKSDGIKRGTELEIFEKGEEIFDPDNNQSLGTLDIIKAYLIVTDVFEKMCVCKNARSHVTDILDPIQNFQIYKPARLKVDPSQITGPMANSDMIIKIGDLVRLS